MLPHAFDGFEWCRMLSNGFESLRIVSDGSSVFEGSRMFRMCSNVVVVLSLVGDGCWVMCTVRWLRPIVLFCSVGGVRYVFVACACCLFLLCLFVLCC